MQGVTQCRPWQSRSGIPTSTRSRIPAGSWSQEPPSEFELPAGQPSSPVTVRCLCAVRRLEQYYSYLHITHPAPMSRPIGTGTPSELCLSLESPPVHFPTAVGAIDWSYLVMNPCIHRHSDSAKCRARAHCMSSRTIIVPANVNGNTKHGHIGRREACVAWCKCLCDEFKDRTRRKRKYT